MPQHNTSWKCDIPDKSSFNHTQLLDISVAQQNPDQSRAEVVMHIWSQKMERKCQIGLLLLENQILLLPKLFGPLLLGFSQLGDGENNHPALDLPTGTISFVLIINPALFCFLGLADHDQGCRFQLGTWRGFQGRARGGCQDWSSRGLGECSKEEPGEDDRMGFSASMEPGNPLAAWRAAGPFKINLKLNA